MKRYLRAGAFGLVILGLLLYGAWWWMLRSEWLREKLRVRAVQEIEKATGGRVELGRLDFDPSLLWATIHGFTLHGKEPVGARPLVHVDRVEVGLKILSFFKPNVDVKQITITGPRINVIVDEEGRSNLPSPATARPPSTRGPVEQVLRLAADSYVVQDGEFSYDAKKYRFAASGRNLNAQFDLDAKGPVYRGSVSSDEVLVKAGILPQMPVNLAATLVVGNDEIEFPTLRLQSKASTVTGKGRIENFGAAHGRFELALVTDLSESGRLFDAPAGTGTVRTTGTFDWLGGKEVRYEGDLRAPALDVKIAGVRVSPVEVTGHLLASEKGLDVTDVRARTSEGTFTGSVRLPGYDGYLVDGKVEGWSLATVLERTGNEPIGYSGTMAGPVRLEGIWKGSLRADATVRFTAREGGVPLEGLIALRYDKAAKRIEFKDSFLTMPHSRVDIDGTLMETMRVKFSSNDLADLQPALALAGETPPLPVTFGENGRVLFEGTVSGALRDPLIAGQLRAVHAKWGDFDLDALSSTVLAAEDKLTLTRFSVTEGSATATGSASIALRNWKVSGTSEIDVRAEARNLNVGELRRQAGFKQPIEGLLHANAQVKGTIDEPRGEGQVDWFRPAYGDERLDRLRATVKQEQNKLLVTQFEATRGKAKLTGTGTFAHGRADWRTGTASANVQLTGLELGTLPAAQSVRKGAGGLLSASAEVQARVTSGSVALSSLNAEGKLANVVIDQKRYGDVSLTAKTRNNAEVAIDIKGSLRGSAFTATSQWQLAPNYPGTAHLEFEELSFSVLNELRPEHVAAEQWPFSGAFSGSVDFRGPAMDIDKWNVDVTLNQLYARPERKQTLPGKTTAEDFELRNDGPVQFSASGRTVTIKSAKFVAKDTNLSVSGTFSLAEKRPWDLTANGQLNLAGLRTFSPDIVASGVATVQANVRGELANPQVFGALELKNATLNMDGIPNGLDKVTGRVLFDRRRATIENRLTAESGGGELALSGFIDFSSDDTFYRLQAEANRVRIRYPEGVSTVANANVSLSGTTERSLLAGSVTVLRSGFTPRTDLGSLLAESGRGTSTPREANRFLANMQVDVKVGTSPETQFMTSLTNDLQAEANLQIRGTGARPVALGRITVSQGDINFFGNKYSIKRGEVSFYNPTKVEPTLDLDLETRVRGVDVTVNFTGPVDKLNVSYRSDPPLQPSEIIALLTVGRSPTASTVGSSQSAARGSFLESGANSLLGSAITAPISSQLQRFFGVSRIKIDPTISGLEGTPQARVTVEQQVSKDVTVTFVTNLNRSQQQVVRLEWNLSKEWSLIALRDENGSFGVDFQVRKQLK